MEYKKANIQMFRPGVNKEWIHSTLTTLDSILIKLADQDPKDEYSIKYLQVCHLPDEERITSECLGWVIQ